jgi:broad specificity phosphatase PhoE
VASVEAMTTLLLARHGETDWNRDRRIQGHSDTPLNETGREQARELARALAEIDLVAAYSSDLVRARETAGIAVAGRGIDVVELPELRERSFGSWEGLADDEVPTRDPEAYERWRAGQGEGAHDAEPHVELLERIRSAVDRIAAEHPEGNVLVVSHGGPLKVVHALAHGLDYLEHRQSIPWVANCALTRWAVRDGILTPVH